jgi:uncharacterized membrane protein
VQQERSPRDDVAFGIRQLVDIAERAQSPGVNDPTTATECVNLTHDLLWHLSLRPMRDGLHRDEAGAVRVLQPTWTWAEFVQLGMDENRHWGADSLQMHRQLHAVIDDLIDVLGEDSPRAEPLREQRRLLVARASIDLPEPEQEALRHKIGVKDA